MVHWSLPVIAQGVVTAGAGITVGYWLFARQRTFHAKDTAAVLVANLNGAHAVLYHVAQPIDPMDSIGRADALKAIRSFVDDYSGIMPSIGILGHEIVRRIGRIYAELNILALDIEGVDFGLEAVIGRTQPLSQSIRSDAMKKWFEGSEEVIDQMESDVAALSADICTKFGLPIEVNTALFVPVDGAESEGEGKQKGGT